jgi:hypothetical protein
MAIAPGVNRCRDKALEDDVPVPVGVRAVLELLPPGEPVGTWVSRDVDDVAEVEAESELPPPDSCANPMDGGSAR